MGALEKPTVNDDVRVRSGLAGADGNDALNCERQIVGQVLDRLPQVTDNPYLARNAVFRALAVLVFSATTVGCTGAVRPLRTEVRSRAGG
jgi:hypothetical protein